MSEPSGDELDWQLAMARGSVRRAGAVVRWRVVALALGLGLLAGTWCVLHR